jgi:hypothetical protein
MARDSYCAAEYRSARGQTAGQVKIDSGWLVLTRGLLLQGGGPMEVAVSLPL